MNERTKNWMKRNLPLITLGFLALLALLYLGDDIVRQRESRISFEVIPPSVEKTDPLQGAEDPSVTIIEFGDFTCTACAQQVQVLKDLVNDYPNDVLVVWKDAPLDVLKPESKNASIAAHCAAEQEKFWEMHDLLFESQSELGRDLYIELAAELELSADEFTACIDNRETSSIVERNIEAAEDAQITSTPTFFIDGTPYEGYMNYEEFIRALNAA